MIFFKNIFGKPLFEQDPPLTKKRINAPEPDPEGRARDLNPDEIDPLDPEIHITGYGVMPRRCCGRHPPIRENWDASSKLSIAIPRDSAG